MSQKRGLRDDRMQLQRFSRNSASGPRHHPSTQFHIIHFICTRKIDTKNDSFIYSESNNIHENWKGVGRQTDVKWNVSCHCNKQYPFSLPSFLLHCIATRLSRGKRDLYMEKPLQQTAPMMQSCSRSRIVCPSNPKAFSAWYCLAMALALGTDKTRHIRHGSQGEQLWQRCEMLFLRWRESDRDEELDCILYVCVILYILYTYIAIKLTFKLKSNHPFYISFYISLQSNKIQHHRGRKGWIICIKNMYS